MTWTHGKLEALRGEKIFSKIFKNLLYVMVDSWSPLLFKLNSWMNGEKKWTEHNTTNKIILKSFHPILSSYAVLSFVIITAFLIYSKSYTSSYPTWTRASSKTCFCVIDDIKDVKRPLFPLRIILITVSESTGYDKSLTQIITSNRRLTLHRRRQ